MPNYRNRSVFVIAAVLSVGVLAALWIATQVITPLPDATKLVRLAAVAGDRVSYKAEVHSTASYRGKTMKVRAIVRHSPEAERVDYLNGPVRGMVVYTRGDDSYTIKPGQSTAMLTRSESFTDKARLTQMALGNYSAVASGHSKVAGRPCHVVVLSPKNARGPSKRLFIDKRTYVALRTDNLSANGAVLGSSEFKSIHFGRTSRADLLSLPAGVKVSDTSSSGTSDLASLSKKLGFSVTLPKYLPAGYMLDRVRLFSCSCRCGHQSAHLSYTNGMNIISVFETSRLDHCGSGSCEMGQSRANHQCMMSDNGQSRVVITVKKSKSVVVVGDIEASELQRIATSVP